MSNEWTPVALGNIASISLSGVDKHITPGEASVRLCNYLDVYRHSRLTGAHDFSPGTATQSEVERFQLRKGDVLITKDSETPDDIGVPAVVVDDIADTICGYHLALIRPTERVNPGFLLYQFQSEVAKRHFLRTATGVTRFGLGIRAIASLPVLLPSPEEQAGIARILDSVDTAIERTWEAVKRARELKDSLLHRLLRSGVRGEPSQKSLAGLIPTSWACEMLGQHILNGPTNGVYLPESSYVTHGAPIVRIDSFDGGGIHGLGSLRRVKIDALIAKRYALNRNDILINRVNALSHIGKAALVPEMLEPTVFESNMMRLQVCDRLLPEFLILVLCSDMARRHWLSRAKSAVNQASINQRDVKELWVPVPQPEEQKEIAATMAGATAHIDSLVAKSDAQRTLKRALMHDLLTGKVRVPVAGKPVGTAV